jgi:HSP20 family molecular chaperone IbpA
MGNLARYTAADLPQLMERIQRNSIGVDEYLDRFFNVPSQQNYPPYNIIQVNNVETKLEVALAGFKKKDIKVYTEHGKLFVEGGKDKTTEDTDKFYHQGLAQRAFNRSWTISDDTEVKSVDFEDGLLTITVSKIVPEHYARKDWL